MNKAARLLAAVVLLAGVWAHGTSALAGPNDPLFINMTTDDSHRAKMALVFGSRQMERGHPLTLFLNDKGVRVGSKAHAAQYAEHQKLMRELMGKWAVVLACPMCMEHYQVKAEDLLEGVRQGNPDLTGGQLFQDNTKTLTW